jgi:hypothetical protein
MRCHVVSYREIMNRPTLVGATCVILLVLLCTPAALTAQSDTIRRNPNAVKLTRIWSKQGTIEGQREVGWKVAAVGDITGDGIADFAVERRDSFDIFAGDRPVPSTRPFRTIAVSEASLPTHWRPLVGDLLGDGDSALALELGADVVLYRIREGQLSSAAIGRLRRHQSSTLQWFFGDVTSTDLDGDGADELIVARTSTRENNVPDYHAHILIYRGGPDFSLDAPDAVIRDDEPNEGTSISMAVSDFDRDSHVDIAFVSRYIQTDRTQRLKLKLCFGNGDVLGFATAPDRSIATGGITTRIGAPDTDGDGTGDILLFPGLLFRSNTGKSARTRAFDLLDADLRILGDGHITRDLGPLNDSTGRYSMIGKLPRVLHAYSGGPQGPDPAWDAWYYATADGFASDDWEQVHAPLGDVNGDGWHDIAFGNCIPETCATASR